LKTLAASSKDTRCFARLLRALSPIHSNFSATRIYPNDAMIRGVRDSVKGFPLAMTECHFSIPGNNRNDVLRSWAAGVSYARILNNHQRHGDVLKIATAADFCGTRWNVNAIILGTHPKRTFLMPVAIIMRQYRKYLGDRAVKVTRTPTDIDAVASRTADKLYLNLVNTSRTRTRRVHLNIANMKVSTGKGTVLVDDPTTEISSFNCLKVMQPRDFTLALGKPIELPPASVTSMELTVTSS